MVVGGRWFLTCESGERGSLWAGGGFIRRRFEIVKLRKSPNLRSLLKGLVEGNFGIRITVFI